MTLRRISLSLAALALSACPPATNPPPGTGAPQASVSPAAVDFPQAGCGGAATKSVTVANTGDATLTFSASTGAAGVFSVSPASGSVEPGQSATLTVTAAVPATDAAGASHQGVLSLTTNDAAGRKDVALTATASGATLTLTPLVASFGVLPVNTDAPALPLTLTNTGNAAATVTFTQPADGQFSLAWAGAPAAVTLAPGASVPMLKAGFIPSAITPSSGGAGVAVAEATCGASVTSIPMTGQGTNGAVGFSTTDVYFGASGRVDCGSQAASKTFTIHNTGNRAFAWTATLAKGASSPYTVTPSSGTVPANNGAVTVTVATAAIPAQAYTALDGFGDTLTIVTDVANDVSHAIALHQTANGAILTFSQPSVDFGQVPVNNTANAPFAILNDGNTSPTVTLASDNPKFTLDPASPLSVPGTAALFLTGTYAPGTAVTPESASVQLSVDAGDPLCAPLPAALAMTGQGTSGSVSYSPVALDFGAVDCGATAAARTVTFRNAGNQAYTVTPALGRDAGSPFTVTMVPPSGVAAVDGGTVVITVAPRAIPQTSAVTPNLYGDTLTVRTDVAADSPHDIPLRLTAHGAIFAISATSLDFGSVAVGATASSQFTVTNNGNATGTLAFTPGQPAIFTMPASAAVAANTSSGQTGSFTPVGSRSYSDTATIAAASGTVLCQPLPFTAISLAGVGTASNVVALSASSLSFGAGGLVPCGTTAAAQTVTVTNNSSQALSLALTLAAGASSPYTVSGPASVAAGASATVTVTPKAVPATSSTAVDAFADTLSIAASGGPVSETHTVALHETAQGAVLTFNPTALAFTANWGSSQAKNFTVTNSGNVSAPYTLALSGANAADFAVSPTAGAAPSGASGSETATFTPPLLGGTRTASVSVSTTAVRCAPLPSALPLTGN